MASVGYMPDITGDIVSFGSSHFAALLLKGAVLEENRPIKTVSEAVLCHLIRNVNYLARPDNHIKGCLINGTSLSIAINAMEPVNF
jgi:hypothetical protein